MNDTPFGGVISAREYQLPVERTFELDIVRWRYNIARKVVVKTGPHVLQGCVLITSINGPAVEFIRTAKEAENKQTNKQNQIPDEHEEWSSCGLLLYIRRNVDLLL